MTTPSTSLLILAAAFAAAYLLITAPVASRTEQAVAQWYARHPDSVTNIHLYRKLKAAGFPNSVSVVQVRASRLGKTLRLGAFSLVLCLGSVSLTRGLALPGWLMPTVCFAVPGLVMAFVWAQSVSTLDQQVATRRQAFRAAWPLLLMNLALLRRAGITTVSALEEIAQSMPRGVVRDELDRALSLVRAGRPLQAALTDLAERSDYGPARDSISLLIASESAGVDDSAFALESTLRLTAARYIEAETQLDDIAEKINLKDVAGKMSTALVVAVLVPAIVGAVASGSGLSV